LITIPPHNSKIVLKLFEPSKNKRFWWLNRIPSKNMQVKRKDINGKWFINLRFGHAKNEIAYAQLLSTIIFQ
jgi:hypothetical protein